MHKLVGLKHSTTLQQQQRQQQRKRALASFLRTYIREQITTQTKEEEAAEPSRESVHFLVISIRLLLLLTPASIFPSASKLIYSEHKTKCRDSTSTASFPRTR